MKVLNGCLGVLLLSFVAVPGARADISCNLIDLSQGCTEVLGCAPEVANGNLQASDRVLLKLSGLPEFANALTFKTQVKNLTQQPSPQKIAAYFKMIGIDASDKDAVVNFIGAREIPSNALATLQKFADLTPSQADRVAKELQLALRGSLN